MAERSSSGYGEFLVGSFVQMYAVIHSLTSHLVKTGKYRDGDEGREGQHPPDEVHPTFSNFVESLLAEMR